MGRKQDSLADFDATAAGDDADSALNLNSNSNSNLDGWFVAHDASTMDEPVTVRRRSSALSPEGGGGQSAITHSDRDGKLLLNINQVCTGNGKVHQYRAALDTVLLHPCLASRPCSK